MTSPAAHTTFAHAGSDERSRRGRRRGRRTRGRFAACLTILAIGGTLPGCGIYGRPRRPAPEPEAAARPAATTAKASMPVQAVLDAHS